MAFLPHFRPFRVPVRTLVRPLLLTVRIEQKKGGTQ